MFLQYLRYSIAHLLLLLLLLLLLATSGGSVSAFFAPPFTTTGTSGRPSCYWKEPCKGGRMIDGSVNVMVMNSKCKTGRSSSDRMMVQAKGKSTKNNNDSEDGPELPTSKMAPGNLFIFPLVALVGVDLLLNILVLTKRTFEALVLGQPPSTHTWW